MNILVAPNAFKGSLSAKRVGELICEALKKEIPHVSIEMIPMADGGEGTIESLLFAYRDQSDLVEIQVTGSHGKTIQTHYGVLKHLDTAVIEVASIVGLSLLTEEERKPLELGTYGVGESIRQILDAGFRRLIIGLGGTATNDGGIGMLQGLGVKFYDRHGNPLPPFASSLNRVAFIDFDSLDPRIKETEISLASDVTNPLCGPNGASYVYGPQKGVMQDQLKEMDQAMASYANVIEQHLQQSFQHQAGAGAAGGLGFAFLCIGAKLESGFSVISKALHLDQKIKAASWVITGEGKTDQQTLCGKLPYSIAERAKKFGVPTILISGSLEGELEPFYRIFRSMHAIANGPITLEESMENIEYLIYHKTRNLARLLTTNNIESSG